MSNLTGTLIALGADLLVLAVIIAGFLIMFDRQTGLRLLRNAGIAFVLFLIAIVALQALMPSLVAAASFVLALAIIAGIVAGLFVLLGQGRPYRRQDQDGPNLAGRRPADPFRIRRRPPDQRGGEIR